MHQETMERCNCFFLGGGGGFCFQRLKQVVEKESNIGVNESDFLREANSFTAIQIFYYLLWKQKFVYYVH
jgi:hypothetical protein